MILKEFTLDLNAVREAYQFDTAVNILPEVDKGLASVRA